MAVHVTIRYVDGTERGFDPGVWPSIRPEGVDAVIVRFDAGAVHLSGHSIYWLYPEGKGTWVLGGASAYSHIPPEVLITNDGTTSRAIDYMPDLAHRCVKLGHWREGEARP